IGRSCLLTLRVNGYNRVPDPPASMMPFIDRFPYVNNTELVNQPESFSAVLPRQHLLAPVAIVEIPTDRAQNTVLEIVAGLPAKLASNLCRVNCVASVVTRPVGNEGLQCRVGIQPLCFHQQILRRGMKLFQRGAYRVDYLEICSLIRAADVVLLS